MTFWNRNWNWINTKSCTLFQSFPSNYFQNYSSPVHKKLGLPDSSLADPIKPLYAVYTSVEELGKQAELNLDRFLKTVKRQQIDFPWPNSLLIFSQGFQVKVPAITVIIRRAERSLFAQGHVKMISFFLPSVTSVYVSSLQIYFSHLSDFWVNTTRGSRLIIFQTFGHRIFFLQVISERNSIFGFFIGQRVYFWVLSLQ